MAEALFRAHAQAAGDGDRWRIESAGTWGVDGEHASPLAETVMTQRGITVKGHIARTVTSEMLRDADAVIVMTRSHRDALSAEFPEARAKIHLISRLNGFDYDVADPYGKPLAAYEACADTLEQLIRRGYDRAAEWAESASTRVENV
jgi:protein arginine phosphatase